VGGGSGAGHAKKHNHLIHLHLIPHIYVPIVHSSGFTEAKNYHSTVEDGSLSPSPNLHHSVDSSSSSEFQTSEVGGTSGATGTSGPGESPSAAAESHTPTGDVNEHDNGSSNFNGHSGENTYYTITEDAVQHVHHDLHENYGNAIDNNSNNNHDYEVPGSNQVPVEEPHQYQVRDNFILLSCTSSHWLIPPPHVINLTVLARRNHSQLVKLKTYMDVSFPESPKLRGS
jgi:hypothetical protein